MFFILPISSFGYVEGRCKWVFKALLTCTYQSLLERNEVLHLMHLFPGYKDSCTC